MKYALCALLLCASCGGPFTMQISSGGLDQAYAHELSMNKELLCTPHLMRSVWDAIKTDFHKSVDGRSFAVEAGGERMEFGDIEDVWTAIYGRHRANPRLGLSDMCNAALSSLVESLGKYNEYVPPHKSAERFARLVGQVYGGIGFLFTVDYNGRRIYVDDVFPDSPAEKGGLRRFDEIVAVDGKAVSGMDMAMAPSFFRGPMGSTSILGVRRGGATLSLKFSKGFNRTKDAYCRMAGDVPYCRVYGFGAKTMENFEKGLASLPKRHPRRVVIDLRNNPGGHIFTATQMLGRLFLKRRTATIMVRRTYGAQPFNDNYDTAMLEGYRAVLLVNGGTVSSSELFAAALKDYKLATLVGEKTFGKGVAQKTSIHYGAIVSIVHAHFLSPFGNLIDGYGVEPDIRVPFTLDDLRAARDPQLERAFALARGR